MTVTIRTLINGKEIPRQRILDWERQRALTVLKKLGVKPAGTDLTSLHQQLLERKQSLGAAGIMRLLHKELVMSERFAALITHLSRGARRFCVIELVADQGSAEEFVAWFETTARANDEPTLLMATPDHYLLQTDANDIMEVVETNGGSPFAARFFVDANDTASLRSPIDPDFPVQFAGVARTTARLAIGGVRHQFRNEGNGFRARLTVEFPRWILSGIVSGHQWHLASEFSNWILRYIAASQEK